MCRIQAFCNVLVHEQQDQLLPHSQSIRTFAPDTFRPNGRRRAFKPWNLKKIDNSRPSLARSSCSQAPIMVESDDIGNDKALIQDAIAQKRSLAVDRI